MHAKQHSKNKPRNRLGALMYIFYSVLQKSRTKILNELSSDDKQIEIRCQKIVFMFLHVQSSLNRAHRLGLQQSITCIFFPHCMTEISRQFVMLKVKAGFIASDAGLDKGSYCTLVICDNLCKINCADNFIFTNLFAFTK